MRDDRPSATAFLIARSSYYLSRDPVLGGFVPVRAAELYGRFVRAGRRLGRAFDRAINSKGLRPLSRALERATLPGIRLHYALRKRYLEETARKAIESGVRQIVVFGAGFDTLALRLAEDFARVEFFEVDHPATQRVKRRVVEAHHPSRPNLHFVALDLAHSSLEECLPGLDDYRTDAPTLFIAEGLLMYLAPAEIDLILEFIRGYAGPKSRFAFTFMEKQEEGRIGFRQSSRLVDAWLRLRGESFKWGIERTRLPEFLAERWFEAKRTVAAETLRELYLAPARLEMVPLAEGECICVAEAV